MSRKHHRTHAAPRVDEQAKIVREIEKEAFFTYEKRVEGGAPGSQESDWLTAERIVLARHEHGEEPR